MASQMLKRFFSCITLAGTPIFYVPAIICLWRISPGSYAKLVASVLLVEVVCGIIKILYATERPVPARKKSTLFQKYEASSFPSIHSARIMAVAVILAALYRNWLLAVAALSVAAAVGYSRIYLKRHHAIDVLGGFAIAAAISIVVLALSK